MTKLNARLVAVTQPIIELKETSPEGLVAYCMTKEHKVLKSDLSWVSVDKIEVGDSVLGFDENGPNRKFKTSLVLSHKTLVQPVVKVLLRSGKIFTVTPEHQWLVSKLRKNKLEPANSFWKKSFELYPGDKIMKLVDMWEEPESGTAYTRGYLSGVYDGEGWLTKTGKKIGFAQLPGVVLDKTLQSLSSLGFDYTTYQRADGCTNTSISGYAQDRMRFLAIVRPERLLQKFTFEMLGNLYSRNLFDEVVSVTSVGDEETVVMETSTKTMILDGYPHHNCARVSNPQHQDKELGTILDYCIRNRHFSIFEMANAIVEVEAPRDITRQLLRHRSFSFQEFSQRYAEIGGQQLTTREFRGQDYKNRQNSIDNLEPHLLEDLNQEVVDTIERSLDTYAWAVGQGVAKECARVFLPEGLTMSKLYVNGTLRSWIHYLDVRDDEGVTQQEHVLLARKIKEVLLPVFPNVLGIK